MRGSNYFIALVPELLKENKDLKVLIGKMKRTLQDKDKVVRWTPPEMWHITVQFLGPLGNQALTEVYGALNSWEPPVKNLALKIQGVGAFPDPQDARVLWLGVQNSQELKQLQRHLSGHLNGLGIDVIDDRPFLPHLTVARLRNLQSVTDLVNLGGRKSFGEYLISEVILFESVLQNQMPKYIPVHRKKIQ